MRAEGADLIACLGLSDHEASAVVASSNSAPEGSSVECRLHGIGGPSAIEYAVTNLGLGLANQIPYERARTAILLLRAIIEAVGKAAL